MESVNKKMSEVEGQTEDLAGRDISSVTCTDCPPICSHPALGFWSFNAGLVLRGVVQKSNKRRKSTCYCQRDQDQRGAACSVWALFQLMQDYHCAPTQIYLCACFTLLFLLKPSLGTWLSPAKNSDCPVGLRQGRRDGNRASLLGAEWRVTDVWKA